MSALQWHFGRVPHPDECAFSDLEDGEAFIWPDTGAVYHVRREGAFRRIGRKLRLVKADEYNATDGEVSLWFAAGAIVHRVKENGHG